MVVDSIIEQQILALIDLTSTMEPVPAKQQFASGLATIIATAIRSATVAVTVNAGIGVQVAVPAGTGATITPGTGTGVVS